MMPVEIMMKISQKTGKIYPLTDKLLSSLAADYAGLDEKRQSELIDRVIELFEDIVKQLESIKGLPDKERLAEMYEALDEKIAHFRHPETKCRRGCSGCCHQIVAVSELEAKVLANEIAEGRIAIDLEQLKRQSKIHDASAYNSRLSREEARCVFLKNGECSVYPVRPMMCRTYHVISEPDKCDPYDYPEYSVSIPNSRTVEFIVSAVFHVSGKEGMLAPLVLENLQKVGFEGA